MQFKYAFAAIAVMAVCSATLVAAGNWTVTEMPQSVLAGISFVTSEDGSLAGGDNGIGPLVLATDNDGASWAMGEIGNATAMILAVRRQCATNGVVAGLGIFTAGTMYTEDGKNWQNSASVAQLTTSQNVEVVPSEDCRSFGVVGSFGSKNGVGLSTDGGKTFKYLDFGGNTQARYGAFPSSKTWYVSGGTWPSSSKSGKAFGGAGSSRLDMATGRYHLTHRIAVNLFKNRVELLKDSDLPEAVNAGGNSTTYEAIVQRTDDAGQTWSNVFNMTAENNMYPNGIACGSVDVCWVTTSGDTASWIYGTTDGGATWQQQHFNNDEALMPAHALSETEAFVAGMNSQTGNGVIYHTTDGGATWELTQLGPVSPGDLSFPSNTNGYASAFTNEGVSAFLQYTSM